MNFAPIATTESSFARSFDQPVTGSIPAGVTLFTNPQTVLNYFVNLIIGYVATQVSLVWLNFLFWDYSKTKPAEEFTASALVAYLANTNVAVFNQLLIWATAFVFAFAFLIPPVVLNTFPDLKAALSGKKRRRRDLFSLGSSMARSSPTYTEGSFLTAWNAVICPFCVSRLIAFNTIAILANFFIWSVTPYLRGGRRRRRAVQNDTRTENSMEDPILAEIQHTLYSSFAKYGDDQYSVRSPNNTAERREF